MEVADLQAVAALDAKVRKLLAQLIGNRFGDADQAVGEAADPLQPSSELREGRKPFRPVQRQQVVDDIVGLDAALAQAAVERVASFDLMGDQVHAQQDVTGLKI